MERLEPRELKILEDGSQSQYILENEFFINKVRELEKYYNDSWIMSSTNEEREELWLKQRVLRELISTLKEPLMKKQEWEYQQQVQELMQ